MTRPSPTCGGTRCAVWPAALILTGLLAGCAALQEPAKAPSPLVMSRAYSGEASRVKTNPLDLKDAVRLGVLVSNDVLTADFLQEQRGNDVQIARAALFPELYFRLGPVAEEDRLGVGSAGLRYTIYDFGERAALLNAAQAGAQQAKFDVLTDIEDSVVATAMTYIDLAVDTEQRGAARRYLRSIDALGKKAQARVDLGAASSIDLNEIETGRLRARAAIIEAEADEKNSRAALTSLTGLSPSSVLSLSQLRSRLAVGTPTAKLGALDAYPKIAALGLDVTAASARAAAAKAGLLPRIGLRLGIGMEVDSSGGVSGTGITAGPEISDAFSLGGGRQEQLRNADLEVQSAAQRLAEATRLLRLDYAQARTRHAANQAQISRRREVVAISTKTRDAMLADYEIGGRSLRDLVDAEERIFNARAELNETIRQSLRDRVLLLKAANLLSEKLYAAPQG